VIYKNVNPWLKINYTFYIHALAWIFFIVLWLDFSYSIVYNRHVLIMYMLYYDYIYYII
jgi:hypothetical protein